MSVGSQHDMIVNVWDWRNGGKVASNKISTKVKAISFAENGNYFVTAGNRSVAEEVSQVQKKFKALLVVLSCVCTYETCLYDIYEH